MKERVEEIERESCGHDAAEDEIEHGCPHAFAAQRA
jgi:hypothetical protein